MKKLILAIISLVPLFCFAQGDVKQVDPESNNQPLKFTIMADKERYSTGDEVKISCIIENVSDKPIRFCRDKCPAKKIFIKNVFYEGKWCTCVNAKEVAVDPLCEEITLEPGQQFKYSHNGKINFASKEIVLGGEKKGYRDGVQGLIIQFDELGKYLEDGFGEYDISTKYATGYSVGIPREQLSNIWQGTLLSNTIKIKIEEKK